jgi:hypothetical protein
MALSGKPVLSIGEGSLICFEIIRQIFPIVNAVMSP